MLTVTYREEKSTRRYLPWSWNPELSTPQHRRAIIWIICSPPIPHSPGNGPYSRTLPEALHPEQLLPLQITAKPLAENDMPGHELWGLYRRRRRRIGNSDQICTTAKTMTPPEPWFRPPQNTRMILTLVVETDGTSSNIEVTKALGLGLDQKAIEAVRQWKFKPATIAGKPVRARANVEVAFRLMGP